MTKENTTTQKPTRQTALKPVGVTFLNDLVKETKKRSRYYLSEDKTQFIEYNKVFSKEKQDALLKEVAEASLHCEINKINYLQNDIEYIQYTHFMMIKYFSSFDKVLKDKDFDYHITVMRNMYDTGLHDLFFAEIFDKKEVDRIIKYMYQVRDTMDKLEETVNKNKNKRIQEHNDSVEK